jgi:hypothetical protein
MTRLTRRAICFALLAMLAMPHAGRAEDAAEQKPIAAAHKTSDEKPTVQIAILLDNSGSMSGLINQARTELWKVVNEFVAAEINGVRPNLQVAVYHYGNPPATQLVPLTDDLDRVSEALFGIPVSGGSEYCGQVIDMATRDLAWSDSRRDLKLIFIAGNEPFSQGPVDYRQACKAAIEKGIMVNTIHCGNGIPQDWREGALLADGKSMNIDQNQAVVNIEAPQDAEIAKLGVDLNKTYIAYGKQGKAGADRQMAQDANANAASTAVAQQRAVAKANAFYRNSAWDLCDALKEGKIDLAKIKPEELPENMRKMTPAERLAYVKKMQDDRAAIQTKINQLNEQRTKFVAEKQKELAEQAGDDTLDQALIGAIREQATKKQFTFGP